MSTRLQQDRKRKISGVNENLMKKGKRFVFAHEHQNFHPSVNSNAREFPPAAPPQTPAISATPAFPWYELALPATILAFVIFGVLLIVGFAIYKLAQYCAGTKKRRLTRDNIFYQSIKKSSNLGRKKPPTTTYRYRFIRKASSAMEPEEADIGVVVNEEIKSKKSPPPSPKDDEDDDDDDEEEEMQTPEASPSVVVSMQYPMTPTLPSYPIQPLDHPRDEINSNLDRAPVPVSSFSYLHGDICCVQPMFNQSPKECLDNLISNKENAMPDDATAVYNLNSPKIFRTQDILKEQSPRQTTDSSTSSPLFTACEVITGGSAASRFSFSPKIIQNLNSGSPLLPSSGLRHGNYFKFPEVDVFTPKQASLAATATTEENNNSDATPLIENLQIADALEAANACNTNNHQKNVQNANLLHEGRTKPRRVRLKSISLDSDGARLVEENISMPVEELVEMSTCPVSSSFDVSRQENELVFQFGSGCKGKSRRKNIHNLTIDVNQAGQEFQCIGDRRREEIPPPPQTPKTPIQKAASLDSEPTYLSIPQGQTKLSAASINSVSVPSTPKRQPSKLKLAHKMYTTANKSYGCLRQPSSMDAGCAGSNNNLYYQKSNRKLRSYDENIAGLGEEAEPKMTTLQVAKFNPLSVSNNNLKTLPEVTMVNDFGDTPVTTMQEPPAQTPKTKSSILQRRSSNHSLTLNVDGGGGGGGCGGSVTNLARGLSLSNYSLGTMQGSSFNLHNPAPGLSIYVDPAQRQERQQQQQQQQHQPQNRAHSKLLQRRGSNTSLSLNIQGSNSSLNRFCSHNSLNIQEKRKGLLERRDSNRSLTLNIGQKALSVSNCNLHGYASTSLSNVQQRFDSCDHPDGPSETQSTDRRFYSSENLTHFTLLSKYSSHGNSTPYGSVDDFKRRTIVKDIDIDDEWTAPAASTEGTDETIRNISTKPLSPQATTEDFKIYLANIQFLQNASNVLTEKNLAALNEIFQKNYSSKSDTENPILDCFLTEEQQADKEDQKQTIRSLHHEFWDLPSNYQEKPLVFGSQAKNRYKTILPNEHSRVLLEPEPGATQKPYVNANYIKGPDYTADCYIATQGPMQNTIHDFWLMVYQNIQTAGQVGHAKIAMLTDFCENNRQKCTAYFPKDRHEVMASTSSGRTEDVDLVLAHRERIFTEAGKCTDLDDDPFQPNFNFFLLQNLDIRCKNGYSIRKLKIVYSFADEDGRRVLEFPVFHYWFPDWPDHRSPDDIDVLLDMSLDLLDGDCELDFGTESMSGATDGGPLPIIHCSAGIGRTGCLMAILNGLRQMRASINLDTRTMTEAVTEAQTSTLSVDVLGIVCNLRLQRGGMVQNSEQYELIHRALCLYYQRLTLEQEKHLSTQL